MCQKRKALRSPEFARAYRRLGGAYELAARTASAGLVGRTKAFHTRFLEPGHRVLYPGVGAGEELAAAAGRGASVVGVDPVASSIERARRRCAAAGVEARLLVTNIEDFQDGEPFDAVAAHFFLNLYAERAMRDALGALAVRLKPGGRFFVADFAEPGEGAGRFIRRAHYRAIAAAGCALGLAEAHPLYDYAAHFEEAGIAYVARRGFGPPGGPDLYACWVGVRA